MGLPLWKPREERNQDKDASDRTSNPALRFLPLRSTPRSGRVPPPSALLSQRRPIYNDVLAAMRRSRHRQLRWETNYPSSVLDRLEPLPVDRDRTDGQLLEQDGMITTGLPRLRLRMLIERRFREKENLLSQLQHSLQVLEQRISGQVHNASDETSISAFIRDELPIILAEAASISSASSDDDDLGERSTEDRLLDELLQIPPYVNRLHTLESDIMNAHRRVREQLAITGTHLSGLQPSFSPAASSSSSARSRLQSPPPNPFNLGSLRGRVRNVFP